ncbi:MAG: hypothetical protein COX77_04535 [Candidatus Komeilibacteria bacterium CG_4_10_14_0_2_um_filter_37_10]|uniref:Uncharacterized protein n=1 Tax=Candidatus Komeilibacteria bacterium CG_4_10_14_0_2_um_filter_37_10 TaxID=1974470 RepID=A0A2M7VDE6_9BACT|nr:MAG: hypothetical protein COX77_04535 [Candidatus Komeilibacteria bacterium CG_4_10_14_0_2_um_filter_37_10]
MVVSFLLLSVFSPVLASTGIMDNLKSVAGQGYDANKDYDAATIRELVGSIVQIGLGLIGALFLILVIISGIQWMTAGGNTDKINKARQRLINSVIGLGIVLVAWVIVYTILDLINTVG